MDPEFVSDWDKVKARYEAWWHNEIVDRPPVVVSCQRATPRWPLRPLPSPEDIEPQRYYFDAEYRIGEIENALATTDYFGDTIPTFHRGVNTAYLALFAEAIPKFVPGQTTVWCEPFIGDWDKAAQPTFDRGHEMFRKIVAVADAIAANARGRYMLALPDHLDVVTTMSQMRGVGEFCIDLIEEREAVCAYRDAHIAAWKESFDFWFDFDRQAGFDGITNWAGAYSATRGGVLQCDFCAMISPAMFEWLVVPELAAEAAHLDGAMYHLDGPGALPHLNLLCDIPGVGVIQWIPGAGNPSAAQWPELLRRLQDAGKALQISCNTEELDLICDTLRPEGVMLRMGQLPDSNACRHVLQRVEKWAAGS